jgi:hypothetical protein
MEIDGATGDVSLFEDTGSTAKFFWDASAESLGIGTTSPAADAKLTLAGDTTNGTIIRFDQPTIANWKMGVVPNTDAFAIYGFGAGAYPERIRIDSSGNVGIGTTSVSSKLHVKASVDSINSGIRLESQDGTEYATIDHNNAGDTRFYQNGVSRMRIDSSGNVGIGTASPATALDVDGGINGSHATFSGQASRGLVISTANTLSNDDGVIYNAQTASSGKHIWQTSGTERMRIDSSGNLLVGKTTANTFNSLAGFEVQSNGLLANTRDGGIVQIMNRLTSDGDIAVFRKDGTTVGSIGANSSNAYISGTTRGLHFTGTAGIIPCNEAGAARDADTDIGSSSTRFKDLYLSGGVYLGGTGAANKLDDYEEGTFTATVTPSTSGSVSLYGTNNTLSYTKIGDLVTVMGTIVISATSSPVGSSFEVNLPFTTANLTEASERSTSIVTLNNGSTFTGYAATSVGGVSTMDVHIDPSVLAADNQLYICHTFKAA